MRCPVCGATLSTLVPENVLPSRLAVRRCDSCGIDFLNGLPGEDYWETPGQQEIYDDKDVGSEREEFFRAILDRIESFGARGSLLDVGAGRGEFACAAAARGWRVSVVEPSRQATEGLAEKDAERIFNVAFEDFEPSTRYDCVTLLDVLEHTGNPRTVISKAADCLARGGLLVVLTPDGGSLMRSVGVAAARWLPATSGILKYQYYLPHLCYVSARGFEALVSDSGLEVIRIERTATPRRFLLAKLKQHYGKYRGNRAFSAAVSAAYPLARVFLRNKLLAFARKPS